MGWLAGVVCVGLAECVCVCVYARVCVCVCVAVKRRGVRVDVEDRHRGSRPPVQAQVAEIRNPKPTGRTSSVSKSKPPPRKCKLNRIYDIEGKYYADGEDAYEMRKYFGPAPPALAKKAAALTAQATGLPAPTAASS